MTGVHGVGAHYTPAALAQHVAGLAADYLTPCPPSPPRTLHLCDPACGEGVFLQAADKWLGSAQVHLYGIDIDPRAVQIAKTRLSHATRSVVSIAVGDSLIDDHLFAEVVAAGGFDLVIGNPPWVSLTGRFGARAYTAEQVVRLHQRLGGSTYAPNLAEFFIRRALALLRPGGILAFIVPDRVGINAACGDLRRRLRHETTLLRLEYGVPFPGVTADTLILVARKSPPEKGHLIPVTLRMGHPTLHEQLRAGDADEAPFPYPIDPAVAATVELLDRADTVPLGSLCSITSGFGGRSALITTARKNRRQRPVWCGASVARYLVRRAQHTYWFEFKAAHLTGRTTDQKKLGATPKLLIRKTGDRLVAAFDLSGTYPEQSLYFCYANHSGYDWLFLLGLLSSALLTVYLRARSLTNPGSFPHLKLCDLRALPIPRLDLNDRVQRRLHNDIVRAVAQVVHAYATDSISALRIAALEKRIDRLSEQAYGLRPASRGGKRRARRV